MTLRIERSVRQGIVVFTLSATHQKGALRRVGIMETISGRFRAPLVYVAVIALYRHSDAELTREALFRKRQPIWCIGRIFDH
jgi:hypothetical protein